MANDMAIRSEYVNFAKNCLASQMGESRVSDEELTKEADYFVEVILKFFVPAEEGRAAFQAKVLAGFSDPKAETIKGFIKDRAVLFVPGYPRGCDLSALPDATLALLYPIKDIGSCISSLLMEETPPGLMNEDGLNTLYKKAFEHVEMRYLIQACRELHLRYTKNEDSWAGFCLLWLIKLATQSEFEIPVNELFTLVSVKEVLSAIIEENIPIKVSSKLVEILFDYTPDRSKFLYKVLLNEERYSAFLNLAEECLLTVPKDVWPAKWNIFVRYNNQLSYSQWITFVQKLVVSKDGMNSQIGALILELLQPSHDRRLPRFKGLKTLLPKEIHEWLSGLFGKT